MCEADRSQLRTSPFNFVFVNLPYRHFDPAQRPGRLRTVRCAFQRVLPAVDLIEQRYSLLDRSTLSLVSQVEMRGLEPLTSALQRRRSPN
jgi:hypothetical protein